VLVACTGCSVTLSAKRTGPTPVPHVVKRHVAASHLPRLLESPPSGRYQATIPAHPTTAEQTFEDGLDRYCRSFYLTQRAGDERYPTAALGHQFAVLQVNEDRRLIQDLDGLRPPPDQVTAYGDFVANEQQVLQAREHLASTDASLVDQGRDDFNAALAVRHFYALRLGARACDGVLPPDQWRAAARSVQRFILTDDPQQACVGLVTPTFVPSKWPNARRPLARCVRVFRAQVLATPRLRNIRVSTLSGVENLSATVGFTEVPECGCGTISVRLYFDHGRWLVRSASTQ
jgi:hypothetical protein